MRPFDKIDDNLFQGSSPGEFGGYDHSQFKFIVNVAPWWEYQTSQEQTVTKAYLFDSPKIADKRLLVALADYVNAVRKIGPTLVHCQMGLNRSGLIVGLALIRAGMKPDAAVDLVRRRREGALFNLSFVSWLLEQEKACTTS